HAKHGGGARESDADLAAEGSPRVPLHQPSAGSPPHAGEDLMHPNPAFRTEDRALLEALIAQVGFGMVFAATPDGPRVAHTPLVSTGDGAVQFHLARANALTRHLPGANALAVVNGPDAYVSPRWYEAPGQVPTWNYVALELEGPVRR